jgi:ribonuclease D
LITQASALERLARLLAGESLIAVDTESNSLYAYQEQVCLIQFSIAGHDFVVDPLALSDLSCLAPIFSNPAIEKVFHAAEYDLICLKRDFGFEFANLFDTMIAARILGRKEVGLGALLQAEFGVSVNKRHQRANWGVRPLPPYLLAYAQVDTHYLIPLRNRLRAELEGRGLWPLAQEDFQRLSRVNGHAAGHKDDCWRVSGAHDLAAQNAAVLKELCRYRDQVARALNRPLFKVIGDRALLAIAQACPSSLDELRRLSALSPLQIERYGKELLAAVQRGLAASPLFPPYTPRPDEAFLNRLEALRHWRKKTAQKMGVQSDVILPRDLLHTLAEHNPQTEDALAVLMKDVPWRFAHFGKQILEVLAAA